MKRWLVRAGVSIAVVVSAAAISWTWTWFTSPVATQIGPETTVIEQPLREDGLIDYVAALNAGGVPAEENAYADLVLLIPPDEWEEGGLVHDAIHDQPPEAYREQLLDRLGVDDPGPDAVYFEPMATYARRRAEAVGGAWSETSEDADFEESARLGSGGPSDPTGWRPWVREGNPRWEAELAWAHYRPWSEAEFPLAAEWLDEQEAALERVKAVAQRERYWSPVVSTDPDGHLPRMLLYENPTTPVLRAMADGLTARAMRRLDAGEAAGAMDDLLAVRRLARLAAQGVSLGERSWAAQTTTRLARLIARYFIAHEAVTADHLRTFRQEWAAISERVSLTEPMKLARFTLLDTLQRPTLRSFGDPDTPPSLRANWRLLDRNRGMRQANAVFDMFDAVIVAPTGVERRMLYKEIPEWFFDLSELDESAWTAGRVIGSAFGSRRALTDVLMDPLLALGTPDLSGYVGSVDGAEMAETLLDTAFALGEYQREYGDYPETLEALVPEYFAEVPVIPTQPFDEYTLTWGGADENVAYYYDEGRVAVYFEYWTMRGAMTSLVLDWRP